MKIVHKVCMAVAIVVVASSHADAQLWRNIGAGLGQFNFDIRGDQNPLSGGADFQIVNNFVGNTLDFGNWDIALQGPISFDVSTGGRLLNTIDISFRTALSSNGQLAPINYIYNIDSGNQATQVTGSVLMDGNFSMNGFGFYDLQINYSSKQDIAESGNSANGTIESDFDLGPVNISGNIFADILAMIFDPFFANSSINNPFAVFSGGLQLDQVLSSNPQSAKPILLTASDLDSDASVLEQLGGVLPTVAPTPNASGEVVLSPSVIPEPGTILLLLAGVGACLRRSRQY